MKSEARNSAGTFLEDQCETKMLNPKLETLNSKQTQISLPTGRQAKHKTYHPYYPLLTKEGRGEVEF